MYSELKKPKQNIYITENWTIGKHFSLLALVFKISDQQCE